MNDVEAGKSIETIKTVPMRKWKSVTVAME